MSKEILLIEDEKNIAELIQYHLEKEGYKVTRSIRGDQGLEIARKNKPALILLDLMLPGVDGIEICKVIKSNEITMNIPVIMVTAKGEEADKIIGLELGADDYITKPFSPRELVARVKAVLRRGVEVSAKKIFKSGALELDDNRHAVLLGKKSIDLTSKEYELLKIFLQSNGRVLSRDFLLEKVWGIDQSIQIETRTVDMHILQLRKKIKQESNRLVTIKNVGYRFDGVVD